MVILYAGEVVEQGTVQDIFHRPRHPYTEALLVCDPARHRGDPARAADDRGDVPNLLNYPNGLRLRAALSAGVRALPATSRPLDHGARARRNPPAAIC